MTTQLTAPIVAVTVYPGQARITRRGRTDLTPGTQTVTVGSLPWDLHSDSVRVSGRGSATVQGVDIRTERHTRTPDAAVADLTAQRRDLETGLAELADFDRVEGDRIEYLQTLSRRGGREYAGAVASGAAPAERAIEWGQTIAASLTTALATRRELVEQRRLVQEELDRLIREISARIQPQVPDRREVAIELEVTALAGDEPAPVELEISYLVDGAHWDSAYDLRLADSALTMTWFGLISQNTGEDWPECELRLSTARPAIAVHVPELDPWYLAKYEPPVMRPQMMAARGGPMTASLPAPQAMAYGATSDAMAGAPEITSEIATVEQGATATTYTPRRPIAVPADGTSHRATVATLDLPVRLDHVTVPLRGSEAFLRATATNSSEHAILPGHAALFHEAEYVGSTELPPWAPGEEVELALGIDDRVRVERELVRRSVGKAAIGGTERREVSYKITVGNYGPALANLTVQDQAPVSRDPAITVRDVTCRPRETDRTELGVLTWKIELQPGAKTEIVVGFRVDVGKGVQLVGWRE
ncbi:DUF4139 domain-containing protein [Fodinicola feengrottensis]|uniref:DUF4139 domain-containing protein n=1 Tax=Fodinicola feengrottensis TaxID=435914 RepID=UPI0031D9CE52